MITYNGSYHYAESKIIMLFKISLLFMRFGAYSFWETIDKFFCWFDLVRIQNMDLVQGPPHGHGPWTTSHSFPWTTPNFQQEIAHVNMKNLPEVRV